MPKKRKDPRGRGLRKGETFEENRKLYRYTYTDQFGTRKSIYSKDLAGLREREKQVQCDRIDGLETYVHGRADVNFVFDRYIETKTSLRSTTKTNYVYTYDRYVRNGFGKKKVTDVHFSDVMLFYRALLDKGLKVNTVDSVHTVLHPVFQMAVRDNVIRSNPSDRVMAELKRNNADWYGIRHALSVEEEQAFLDALEDPELYRWKPLFIVMFGTGCRISEIIGLRWDDLDFEGNVISINHSVTYYPRADNSYKCEYEVSRPKTEAGVRTIPMLRKVREALELEKSNQAKYGYRNRAELDGMTGFIFCNRFEGLHKPGNINKQIKRIVDGHNAREELKAARKGCRPVLIPHFSCHIARHTFCTRLCENETNIKVIQSVMGHKDIQTTLAIYAEVSEMKKQKAFSDLNDNNVV